MTPSRKPSSGQTISRAFGVLRAVADRPGSSLGQIATATGLARSTVQGIVNALSAEGAVIRSFGQQGLYLGMEIAHLAMKVDFDTRSLIRPLMEDLEAELGDNVNMTVYQEGQVLLVERVANNEQIRLYSHIGRSVPIHCSATGKAHLSRLSDEEALRVLGNDLRPLTPSTEVNPKRLMKKIRKSAEKNLFLDEEEWVEGVVAVATNLPVLNGLWLAVSVSMPVSRYHSRRGQVEAAILNFRRAVAEQFHVPD